MNLLKKRYLQPEIMDGPGLERELHHHALQGLRRINILSRVVDQIFDVLAPFVEKKRGRLKILDVATGGGDIPIALAKKAEWRFMPLEIDACDKSETAIEYARSFAEKKNARVRFFSLDVLEDDIPENYDVIISNLFLHHLSIVETQKFLKKISEKAGYGIVVNDLERCWPGFILASSIPPLLTTSAVVHQDGIQSVRAAYSIREIKRIAEDCGLHGAQIKSAWPFRYRLLWMKK